MSGGFFRGTSADQDTRFSNKQAKLLKSQKFAPELENLVDMTRVKMDVMRPWIAKRVTELIGFEDEVLINFIYTLLEEKVVNGKQIQISLTGFMERNTGKFMKELWTLLLSAQQNVSGVPQQFLDAKEEETKKKRAEKDHTINEIRKKEEKPENEKTTMEGDGTFLRDQQVDLEVNINNDTDIPRIQPEDEKDQYKRNDQRRISSRKHSMSPSKSSNSRSYSNERGKSRSASRTPSSRSRSISLERRQRPLPRQSVTQRRKHSYRHSPSQWQRSTYSRRRSTSHSRQRSPSPSRYRGHSLRHHVSQSSRYRSRSPVRRRSRTPLRRSPMRYRSWTPLQHRSPSSVQHRSPSPVRRRSPSPIRRRSPSPVRRRSPSLVRRRSPSPNERSPSSGRRKILSPVYFSSRSRVHRHSPSPMGRLSPSPHRRIQSPARRRYQRSPSSLLEQSLSPVRHRSSVYDRKRSTPVCGKSPPPQELNSPMHIRHNSFSPVKRGSPRSTRSPVKRGKARISEKYSPDRGSPDKRTELPAGNYKGIITLDSRPVISLRSPKRDILEQDDSEINEKELPPSVWKFALLLDNGEGRRSVSPHSSSYHKRDKIQSAIPPQRSSHKSHHDSPGAIADNETNFSSRNIGKYKYRSSEKLSRSPVHRKDISDSVEIRVFTDETKSIKSQLPNSDMLLDKGGDKEYHEYRVFSKTSEIVGFGAKGKESNNVDSSRATDKKKSLTDHSMGSHWVPELEIKQKLPEKSEQNGSMVFPSKEADGLRDRINEKRKHKKLDKRELKSDDNASQDSSEDRKEAKRRRKEEKNLKKGDRRGRREEKRRKRDERRAEKSKLKSVDASCSSDPGLGHSGDEGVRRQESRRTNVLEIESAQRKLEIELREKALESLRAKKGFGN